jgi:hypothetical protein
MPGTFDTSIRSYRFYKRDTASGGDAPNLTTNFADCKLEFIDKSDGKTNFVSQGVVLANDDGVSEIQFSFDGVTVEGDLIANESMNFFTYRRKHIYLRGAAGAEPFRLWAW